MRKNLTYTTFLGPTRLLIFEKSATYTIKWSYTIIWQVRVSELVGKCSSKRGKDLENLGKTNILPLDNNNSKMRKNSICTFKKIPCNDYGQDAKLALIVSISILKRL